MTSLKVYDVSDQTALRIVANRIDAAREYLYAEDVQLAHERLAEAGIVLANFLREFDR
jgi:hypothetical protein